MKKLVIFDLDGTILDTVPDICDAVNAMLTEFNFPCITKAETRSFIGNGAKKLVERALKNNADDEMTDKCFARFSKIYGSYKSVKTKVFDGVEDLLFYLKSSGVKTAVLTNKPQDAADAVLSQLLKNFHFDIVVGQSGNVKCKPDPEETFKILSLFGADKKDSLFVGDGETDYLTAKNAGIDCVSVLWGYRDKEFLASFGAKKFALSPEELKKYIME